MCNSVHFTKANTHVCDGYQVIVPSWHTIPLTLIQKSFNIPFYCMCAVTFAFFFIYTHFLNFTGGLQDIMFNVGVWIFFICLHDRKKERKRKSKKKKVFVFKCVIFHISRISYPTLPNMQLLAWTAWLAAATLQEQWWPTVLHYLPAQRKTGPSPPEKHTHRY